MKNIKKLFYLLIPLLITNCQNNFLDNKIVLESKNSESGNNNKIEEKVENVILPQKLLYYSTQDGNFYGNIFDINAKVEKNLTFSDKNQDCSYFQITDNIMYLNCKKEQKTVLEQAKYNEKYENVIIDNFFLRSKISPKKDKVASEIYDLGDYDYSIIITDSDNNMIKLDEGGVNINWFPDGNRISYLKYNGIYFIDVNGQNKVKVITGNPFPSPYSSNNNLSNLQFSQDGKYLSYFLDNELHLLDIKTNTNKTIAKVPIRYYSIKYDWIPNQNEILVIVGEEYPGNLVKIKAEEPDKQIILSENVFNYKIFSKEKKIFFSGGNGISLINFDGTNKIFLGEKGKNNDLKIDSVTFSPDEKKIAYITRGDYKENCECPINYDSLLYVVNSDGKNNIKVSEQKANVSEFSESLAWSDNNKFLAYAASAGDVSIYDSDKDKSFKIHGPDYNYKIYPKNYFIWLK